jgi:hypothetical protein
MVGMSARSGFVCLSVAATLLIAALAAPVLRAPNERIFGTEIVGRHHDPYTVMQQFASAPVSAPYLQPATDWLGRALAASCHRPPPSMSWCFERSR